MGGVYAYPGGGTPGRVHLCAGAAQSQEQEIFGPAYPLELEDNRTGLSSGRVQLRAWSATSTGNPVRYYRTRYRYTVYGMNTYTVRYPVRYRKYSIPGVYSILVLVY
jgi:hypothetical protein